MLGDTCHYHAEAKGREDFLVVQVLHGMAGQLLVTVDRLLAAGETLQAGNTVAIASLPVQEEPPGQVRFRVAKESHLPVQHGGYLVIPEDEVRQPCVPP